MQWASGKVAGHAEPSLPVLGALAPRRFAEWNLRESTPGSAGAQRPKGVKVKQPPERGSPARVRAVETGGKRGFLGVKKGPSTFQSTPGRVAPISLRDSQGGARLRAVCQQRASTHQGKRLDQEGLSPEEGRARVRDSGESRGRPSPQGRC